MKMPSNLGGKRVEYRPGELQLNYRLFVSRLQIEEVVNRKILRVMHFYIMIVLFCLTIGGYDPVQSMTGVHLSLAQYYKASTLNNIDGISGVTEYLDFFIQQTYKLASAMVDVNTFDDIDPARCFDPNVTDVCRLTYWDVPNTDPSAPNFFNKTEAIDLSIGRLGRYPERPIVLDHRLDYPTPVLVPLAPLLLQTRAKQVPCRGFGNIYNDEVLGAGICPLDNDCPAGTAISSFAGGSANQRLYLTYARPAFVCVNPELEDDVFTDKSWYPGASWTDLHDGKAIEPQIIGGARVFPKFVPDIAYLQAPIHPSVAGERLKADDSMWSDPFVATNPRREQWVQEYLASDKTKRKSTFLTRETKTLKAVAFVISPQGESMPDIYTVAMANFQFSPYGVITSGMEFSSTAQTAPGWYVAASIFWIVALAYAIDIAQRTIRDWHDPRIKTSKLLRVSDVVLTLFPIGYVLAIFILELSPPHINQELIAAFEHNNERRYMELIDHILNYAARFKILKKFGFVVGVALVFRVLLYLEFHPNFALLLHALRRCKLDAWHLLLAGGPIYLCLSFQAWWMFADDHQSAGFNTLSESLRTTLTFVMPSVPSSFTSDNTVMFLMWGLTGLFVLRLFYLVLIAAIVKAAMGAKTTSGETGCEIFTDARDSFQMAIFRLKYKWPQPTRILSALEKDMKQRLEDGAAFEPNAVTPEELANCLGLSLETAAHLLYHYSKKRLGEDGGISLTEGDPRRSFPPGEFHGSPKKTHDAPAGLSQSLAGNTVDQCKNAPGDPVGINVASENPVVHKAALSPELEDILAGAGVQSVVSTWLADNGITQVFAFADIADSKSQVAEVVGKPAGLDPRNGPQMQPLKTAWRRAETFTKAQLEASKRELEIVLADRDNVPPALLRLNVPRSNKPGIDWYGIDTQD